MFKEERIFVDEEIGGGVVNSVVAVPMTGSPPPPPPPLPPLPLPPSLPPTPNINADRVPPAAPTTTTTTTAAATATGDTASVLLNREDSESTSSRRMRYNSEQSVQTTTTNAKSLFLWNSIFAVDSPVPSSSKKITIDRKSWITRVDDKTQQACPLIYSLDASGYPRNPMGRTGIRGRGALHRYGPNHEIMAVVTRWKKSKSLKPIYVERRKLLEFIAVKDKTTGLTKIPGGRIVGDESQYSVVCRTFMELVFEEEDVERGINFVEDDMLTFFASFASQTSIDLSTPTQLSSSSSLQRASRLPAHSAQGTPTTTTTTTATATATSAASESQQRQAWLSELLAELGFMSTMIYRGYIDDPRNTDNAWVEAEIWNFHYDKEDFFDTKIKNPASKWREVSSSVRTSSNEIIADALKEISEIHNAFYN